jgi:hypothetical protein
MHKDNFERVRSPQLPATPFLVALAALSVQASVIAQTPVDNVQAPDAQLSTDAKAQSEDLQRLLARHALEFQELRLTVLNNTTNHEATKVQLSTELTALRAEISSLESSILSVISTNRSQQDNEMLSEARSLLSEFSTRTVSWAGYVLAAGAFFFTLLNAVLVYRVWTTYKESKEISRELERERKEYSEEMHAHVDSLAKKAKTIAGEFDLEMRHKRKLLDRLGRAMTEAIKGSVPQEEVPKLLNTVYREQVEMYEIGSLIADLESPKTEERERAILALEEIGPEGMGVDRTIELLRRKIVENEGESGDLRVQAQRSIESIYLRAQRETPTNSDS